MGKEGGRGYGGGLKRGENRIGDKKKNKVVR